MNEVILENFDLHSTAPTQVGAEVSKEEFIDVQHSIERDGTIDFIVTCGDDEYIDPYNIKLYFAYRILQEDNTRFGPAHDVAIGKYAPVNGAGYAFFKGLVVKLNDTVIADNDVLYSFRGDIESRLSNTIAGKKYTLQLMGFEEEKEAFEDIAEAEIWLPNDGGGAAPVQIVDSALGDRIRSTRRSREKHIITPLFSEIFDQQKFLPPHSKLSISLIRNDYQFSLLSKVNARTYQIAYTKVKLIVRKVKASPELSKQIQSETILRDVKEKYPLRRVEMKYYTKNANSTDLTINNIFEGILPRRFFFVMIRQDSFNGTLTLDPFNYQDFAIREMSFKIGNETLPYPPIEVNFQNNSANCLALYALLRATNTWNGENSLGFGINNYNDRNCIFGYDLAASELPAGESFEPVKEGSSTLSIRLNVGAPHPIVIIVYAEYDAELQIDKNRHVTFYKNA